MPIKTVFSEINRLTISEYFLTNYFGAFNPIYLTPNEIRISELPYHTDSSEQSAYPLIAKSNIDSFISELEVLLTVQDQAEVAQLLRSDFVLTEPEIVTTEEVDNTPHIKQTTNITSQLYQTRPFIEYLIRFHHQAFRNIFALAESIDAENPNAQLRDTIVKQLYELDLSQTDLSRLNLQGAILRKSTLKDTQLFNANFSDAICDDTDLSESQISRQQLNDCRSYKGAKVPGGHWNYWTDETKSQVLDRLIELRRYGKWLRLRRIPRGQIAIDHANELIILINDPNTKFNETFQKNLLKKLRAQNALFARDREYERIIKNIAACVLSGVILYLGAALLNKYFTGKFTFFYKKETRTSKKIKEIEAILPQREKSPMETFTQALHHKQKQSAVNKLGYTNCVPNHSIGGTHPLMLVNSFLVGEPVSSARDEKSQPSRKLSIA